jgi:hypothetical protein
VLLIKVFLVARGGGVPTYSYECVACCLLLAVGGCCGLWW